MVRVRFVRSTDGKVIGLIVRSADAQSDVLARKTDKTPSAETPVIAATFTPKNDDPTLAVPTPSPRTNAASGGKYADYLGRFETPKGLLTFSDEGEQLLAEAGGDRIELVPDPSAKDKFTGRAGPERVTFERNAAGKVIGVIVITGMGQEIKGKRIN